VSNPTLVAILIAATVFGAWLATGVARWLCGFAAAPSWGGFVRGMTQWWLFCWFIQWSWQVAYPPFVESDKLGLDARVYLGGAQAWLAGRDPWASAVWFHDAGTYGFHYAAPPPSLLLFAPFAWMPERLFANLAVIASFMAGFCLLRAVRLPAWWILFPPLLIGILSGNPVVIGLAAVVSGVRWLAPVGVAAKVYLGVGLVAARRWRDVAVVVAVMAATLVVLAPLWFQYAADYSSVSATIAQESAGGLSASRDPMLFAATAACLALLAYVDWRAACWLAMPALSPFAEFHSSIAALPVMSPGLGALLATSGTPWDTLIPKAIAAYCAWRLMRRAAESAGLKLPDWLDVRIRKETAEPEVEPIGAVEVLRGVLADGRALIAEARSRVERD
jgi:hypothetical protein